MAREADSEFGPRDGEVALPFDPGAVEGDARVMFIGRLQTPWHRRADCPKNMADAAARGGGAIVDIDPPFRPGLEGLAGHSHAIVLTWLDRGPRNLIRQKPRHASEARGVFGLRSPARPNPIGVHVVALVAVDAAAGRLELAAIDALDGTPVIDIKPYYASTDAVPGATRNGPR